MQTHTQSKPHVCPICGKVFAQKHGLKRHRLAHPMINTQDGGTPGQPSGPNYSMQQFPLQAYTPQQLAAMQAQHNNHIPVTAGGGIPMEPPPHVAQMIGIRVNAPVGHTVIGGIGGQPQPSSTGSPMPQLIRDDGNDIPQLMPPQHVGHPGPLSLQSSHSSAIGVGGAPASHMHSPHHQGHAGVGGPPVGIVSLSGMPPNINMTPPSMSNMTPMYAMPPPIVSLHGIS
jgi:hypothetical protein